MKIAKIEVGEVNIPLVTPFKTALRTVDHVNDLIVRITADDGQVGFGEAPPTAVITGDTKGSIRCAIEDAWEKRNETVWQLYFPVQTGSTMRRPTNAAFISRLADCALYGEEAG